MKVIFSVLFHTGIEQTFSLGACNVRHNSLLSAGTIRIIGIKQIPLNVTA